MILKINILLITAVAAWMDIRWWKVKNLWILISLAGGLFYDMFAPDSISLVDGLLGVLIPLLLLGGFYLGGYMGAGDIKLFAAIGVWLGTPRIIWFMLIAFSTGILYFLVLIFMKKELNSVLKRKLHVAVCAFVSALVFLGGFY